MQKRALMFCLIHAVIGSAVLSTGGSFPSIHSNVNTPATNGYFSPITYTTDWLAEDTPTVSRARYSNTLLRSGLLRVFVLAGITGIAIFSVKSNSKINKKRGNPEIKKSIVLKLRI